jgi:hypothetical protein
MIYEILTLKSIFCQPSLVPNLPSQTRQGVADFLMAITHNARTGGRVKHYSLMLVVVLPLKKLQKIGPLLSPSCFSIFCDFRSIRPFRFSLKRLSFHSSPHPTFPSKTLISAPDY